MEGEKKDEKGPPMGPCQQCPNAQHSSDVREKLPPLRVVREPRNAEKVVHKKFSVSVRGSWTEHQGHQRSALTERR